MKIIALVMIGSVLAGFTWWMSTWARQVASHWRNVTGGLGLVFCCFAWVYLAMLTLGSVFL